MIVRAFAWLLLLGAVGALALWLGDHPGDVRFEWLGYRVETSMGLALALLLVALMLSGLAVYGMARLSHLPLRYRLSRQRTAQARSLDALTRAFTALAIGDRRSALVQARQAEKQIGPHPLLALVRAQVAQADGDAARARGELEAMLGFDTTRMLAASHLSLLSRREGRTADALTHAETAHRLAPNDFDAGMRLLDLYLLAERWNEADALLARLRRAGAGGTGIAHAEAVLHTLLARERWAAGERQAALAHARKAHRAEPGFVPATLVAVEAALDANRLREALSALRRTWKIAPHPALSALLLGAIAGRSERAQRKLASAMAASRPRHPESLSLLAEIDLLHGRYDEARRLLLEACTLCPEPRLAHRLAEIERKAGLGETAVATLPEDQAWHCGACGVAVPDWRAHCPNCGAFDSLNWNDGERGIAAPRIPVTLGL